jgi:hypothetical protein
MSAKYQNTISVSSTPVYGVLFDYWDSLDWLAYHKALVAAYGNDQANEKFVKAWEDYPAWMLFPVHIGFRNSLWSSNDIFINYCKSVGVYDRLFSGVLGSIFKIQSTAVSVTSDVTAAVSNVASSTKSLSSYLLPLALFAFMIFAFVVLNKKYKLI